MTGQELKNRRRKLNLTQKQLAIALGVNRNTVARWERGERATPSHLELALQSVEHPPAPKWEQIAVFVPASANAKGIEKDMLDLADALGGVVERALDQNLPTEKAVTFYALTAPASQATISEIWRILTAPGMTMEARRDILAFARKQQRSLKSRYWIDPNVWISWSSDSPEPVATLGSTLENMQKRGVGAGTLLTILIAMLNLLIALSNQGGRVVNIKILNPPSTEKESSKTGIAAKPKKVANRKRKPTNRKRIQLGPKPKRK